MTTLAKCHLCGDVIVGADAEELVRHFRVVHHLPLFLMRWPDGEPVVIDDLEPADFLDENAP